MDQRFCEKHCNVEKITFTHKKIQKIWKGRCISHNAKYTDYNAMDKETGELYVVKEICFNSMTNNVKEAKAHLARLVELRHDNLFLIKNFVYAKTKDNKGVFYILQEFSFGYTSLSLFLTEDVTLDKTCIKNFSLSVLSAMNYLKQNEINNVEVRNDSIYVNNTGCIKLYDYGLEVLISNTACVQIVDRYRNSDITFGLFLISLLNGKLVNRENASELPNDYLGDLVTLYKKQKSVDEFWQHMFSESNICMLPYNPVKIESSEKDSKYEIIERLGKGAFGKVYKVKDKTDDKFYALKKIRPSSNKKDDILMEVKHLSQLEHKHIVRYYHAWTQNEDPDSSDTETDEDDSFSDSFNSEVYMELSPTGIKLYVDDSASESNSIDEDAENEIINVPLQNTLYIKMELCHITLTDVIEQKQLYQNSDLIWKYFRQILKGLQHIHDKHIIHRDLKPGNIFLDSNDQIKIGDFGFATTKLRYRPMEEENLKTTKSRDSCTSRVGTIYYKAPELNSSNINICDHKLDMYSLGIILFEMCYQPFVTLSERAKVLSDLRKIEIIFPNDFNDTGLKKQKIIIGNLLNHDAEQRPNCENLIKSDLIPYFQEEKEEEKQLQTLQRIASNPQSRIFQQMFDCYFDRKKYLSNISFENITSIEAAIRVITNVFKRHGAKHFDMTMFTLKDVCNPDCQKCIKLLNQECEVVIIPCNSRISFLNYIVLNNMTWTKRYTVNKTYIFNKNKYDCAFDIITPINLEKHKCFLPDAEILLILSELINSFSTVHANNFVVNINHVDLFEAILEECNILQHPKQKLIINVIQTLSTMYPDHLIKLLSSYNIDKYIHFLKMSKNFDDISISDILKHFQNTNAHRKAAQALQELLNIVTVAKEMGVQYTITLHFGFITDPKHYSGMIVQLSYEDLNRGQNEIAVGGRYDKLLQKFSELYGKKYKRYGVGLTINPEQLTRILKAKHSEVLLCTSSKNMLQKIHQVLKILWEKNIPCRFIKTVNINKCLKNSYNVCIINIKARLFNKKKVEIHYRRNTKILQNWVIGIESLVVAIRTFLNFEPIHQINLENNATVSLSFQKNCNLSYFEKVKCKCVIAEEVNSKQDLKKYSRITVFDDFDENFVFQISKYEKIVEKEIDDKEIIFAFSSIV